jgi:hypothetical protein
VKLRIQGNSIRLRLRQPEVQRLVVEGRLDQSTHFGGDVSFAYALETNANASHVSARFAKNRLTVVIPKNVATDWATSAQVSIKSSQRIDEAGATLSILVEKDFKCLHDGSGEPQDDAYPNPELANS